MAKFFPSALLASPTAPPPAMVEEYIGRPIRTEAQCREDFRLKRHVEYFEEKDPHAAL